MPNLVLWLITYSVVADNNVMFNRGMLWGI